MSELGVRKFVGRSCLVVFDVGCSTRILVAISLMILVDVSFCLDRDWMARLAASNDSRRSLICD